jgi:phosphoribosyl 1,2-cyclic phosphodiesterase
MTTRLWVLGSGSEGNAFAVGAGDQVLLIDAGFSARETRRRAELVDLDLAQVKGIVLTHEHGDHTSGAARLAHTLGIPILTAPGTWSRLRLRMPKARHIPLALMGGIRHGCFQIEACLISHDAAEPIAISISSDEGHRIGIAYDLGRPTTSVRYLLRHCHALIVEANHDEVRLRTSDYPPVVQQRIAGSTGHLSNRAAAELLVQLVHPGLSTVVLAHLSARCNSEAEARAEIWPALMAEGYAGQLHVAPQDRPVGPFNLLRLSREGVLPLF